MKKWISLCVLIFASVVVVAQDFTVKSESLSQAEQQQLANAKQKIVDAQAALDKAIKDDDAIILSVIKAHGYNESYLYHRPGSRSPYLTLSPKSIIVHEECKECQ